MKNMLPPTNSLVKSDSNIIPPTNKIPKTNASTKDLYQNNKYGHFREIHHPYIQVTCNMCGTEVKEESSEEEDPEETSHPEGTHLIDGEINFISINDSVFSIPAFSELQLQDEFCLEKIKGIKDESKLYRLNKNF